MSKKTKVDKNKAKELELQEKVADVAEEANDWRDKYLRTLAELDNMRKRNEREREQLRKFASEGLLRDLLPLIDTLAYGCEAEGDAKAIREGLRMAHDDALRVLVEHGVEPIEAVGLPFDPRWHEAVGMRPADTGQAPGTVIAEERRGYRLGDRVLRASRVLIAVAPPAPEPTEPEQAEERTEEER